MREGVLTQPCANREIGEAGYLSVVFMSFGNVLFKFSDQHVRYLSPGEVIIET